MCSIQATANGKGPTKYQLLALLNTGLTDYPSVGLDKARASERRWNPKILRSGLGSGGKVSIAVGSVYKFMGGRQDEGIDHFWGR